MDDDLTGSENLVLLGRLAGLARRAAKARAAELLAAFGLEKSSSRQVKAYSGGMRRRLDLAASLIVRADLFFFDEPTTGLDPVSRDVNPVSHLVTAERGLLHGQAATGQVAWVLLAAVALTAVFAPVTVYLYGRQR